MKKHTLKHYDESADIPDPKVVMQILNSKSPHDAKSSPTVDEIVAGVWLHHKLSDLPKHKKSLLAHDLALLPKKLDEVGYSDKSYPKAFNQAIDMMAESLRKAYGDATR